MPNKTYAAILGDRANINLSLSDYIQQQVKHNNNKNDMMSLETEYRVFLNSKKFLKDITTPILKLKRLLKKFIKYLGILLIRTVQLGI